MFTHHMPRSPDLPFGGGAPAYPSPEHSRLGAVLHELHRKYQLHIVSSGFNGFSHVRNRQFRAAERALPVSFHDLESVDVCFRQTSLGAPDAGHLHGLISTLPADEIIKEPLLGPNAIIWCLAMASQIAVGDHDGDPDKLPERYPSLWDALPKIGIDQERFKNSIKAVLASAPLHFGASLVMRMYETQDPDTAAALLSTSEIENSPSFSITVPKGPRALEISRLLSGIEEVEWNEEGTIPESIKRKLSRIRSLLPLLPEAEDDRSSALGWFDNAAAGLLEVRLLWQVLNAVPVESFNTNPKLGAEALLFRLTHGAAPYEKSHPAEYTRVEYIGQWYRDSLLRVSDRLALDPSRLEMATYATWAIYGSTNIDHVRRNYELLSAMDRPASEIIPIRDIVAAQRGKAVVPEEFTIEFAMPCPNPANPAAIRAWGEARNTRGFWREGREDGQDVKYYHYVFLDTPFGLLVRRNGEPILVMSMLAKTPNCLLLHQRQAIQTRVMPREYPPDDYPYKHEALAVRPPDLPRGVGWKTLCVDIAMAVSTQLGFDNFAVQCAENQRWVNMMTRDNDNFYDPELAHSVYDEDFLKQRWLRDQDGDWIMTWDTKYASRFGRRILPRL